MEFDEKLKLKAHLNRRTRDKYYCPVCHFTSCFHQGLKLHIDEKHENVYYDLKDVKWTSKEPPPPTNIVFETRKSRKRKMDEKSENSNCVLCSVEFAKTSELKDHYVQAHPGDLQGLEKVFQKFKCDLCDVTFECETSLKLHKMLNKSRINPIIHSCSKCSFQSCSKKALSEHGKIEHVSESTIHVRNEIDE